MAYLIDSDIMSSYLDLERESVFLVEGLLPAGVSISTVTYMEILQGMMIRHGRDTGRDLLLRRIDGLGIVPFDEAIADRCASIRFDLAGQGRRVRQRALDLMIAATAIEYELVLVTRNRSDYADIPGLTMH